VKRDYFIALEQRSNDIPLALSDVVGQLAYNEQGLMPVITQDASTKSILMLAWMNKESLEQTLMTKRMTYWSRSRQQLWVKGELSGNTQKLVSMAFDCDGDAVLCRVDQSGVACHTGRRDCFYLNVDIERNQVLINGKSTEA
jgi:phosphoribosyl-AMP cyclohydrolase